MDSGLLAMSAGAGVALVAQQGQSPAVGGKLSAVGTDNPQEARAQAQAQNLTEDEKRMLVDIVKGCRNQWASDRLLRLSEWMRNLLMYRGSQCLAWDATANTWFDALAWWKQERSEQDDGGFLEKFQCNITQMFGVGFKGIMSRGIPRTAWRPASAENLADVTTAKAAQEAISIIERKNNIGKMVREEAETLYVSGTYFKYTRGVLDGNWAGFDEEEVFGEVPVVRPDRYHCFGCGADTPARQARTMAMATGGVGGGSQCAGCGSALGAESFYQGSQSVEMGVVGTRKIPRAMVKQTVHGPMEVDVDPQAATLAATPTLSFDQEIDIGEARMMFPTDAEEIKEGMLLDTTPNAEYERMRRTEIYSVGGGVTSDATSAKPTYSQNWIQPFAFYRPGDMAFAQKMVALFPDGVKLTLLGDKVVDVRPANLVKEWTSCRLHEKFGMYSPSIADNVVPFNERLNNTMQILDEWTQNSATGMNLIDGSRIDKREMKGKTLRSGDLVDVPMKIHGEPRPMAEAFIHFDLPIEAKMFEYPQMLIQFCQLIACLPPQSMGSGTLPGVETAGGQKQMLDTAQQALHIYWENIKEEHSQAAQNAIECLQKLMKAGAVRELVGVMQDTGSQFRNNYVDMSKMSGQIDAYPNEDQGLPISPEDVRAVMQEIFNQVGNGNPAAQAIMDIPTNRELFLSTLGTPDMVVPDEAQQAKTEQAINTLLESDWLPVPGADGQVGRRLPVMPDKNVEDFPVLKSVMRLFRQENADIARTNPQGWDRLDAYYEMAEEMEMAVAIEDAQRKMKVTAAGAPPPQTPDATVAAARQDILAHAVPMIDRLSDIAQLPPLPKGSSLVSQVAAAKEIAETALKAAALGQG